MSEEKQKDPKTYFDPEFLKVIHARYEQEWAALRHAYQTNLNVRLAMGDWPEWNK